MAIQELPRSGDIDLQVIRKTPPKQGELVRGDNGTVELTEIGRIVKKLVGVDRDLRNHFDPQVSFAMSGELAAKCVSDRETLCQALGLPKDEESRQRMIEDYKKRLRRYGLFSLPDLAPRRK